MKKQEGGRLRGPEDMLALAESLAARYAPCRRPSVLHRLPRWAHDLLWALGGAGAVGFLWLAWAA